MAEQTDKTIEGREKLAKIKAEREKKSQDKDEADKPGKRDKL